MNVTSFRARDYGDSGALRLRKNKASSKPTKPSPANKFDGTLETIRQTRSEKGDQNRNIILA
jgi:hypothetical protein